MPQQQAVFPGQTHLQIPLRPRASELQAAARGQRGERDGMLPLHGVIRGDEFLVLRRLDAQRVGLVGFCTSSAPNGRPQQRTSAPPDDTVSPPQAGQTYHFAFFMFPPSSAPPGSSPASSPSTLTFSAADSAPSSVTSGAPRPVSLN